MLDDLRDFDTVPQRLSLPWLAMAGSLALHAAPVLLLLLHPASAPAPTLSDQVVEITLVTSPPPDIERTASWAGHRTDAHRVDAGQEASPVTQAGLDPGLVSAPPAPGPEPDRFLSLPSAPASPPVDTREAATPASAPVTHATPSPPQPEAPAPVELSELALAAASTKLPPTSPVPRSDPTKPVAAVRTAPPSPRPPVPQATAAAGVAQPRATLLKQAHDASTRRAQQDYLWQVVRKLSQQRFVPRSGATTDRGMVVVRLSVGRDGTVRNIALAKSSGYPEFDRDLLAAIRRASPFAPLPPEIADDPYTMTVPVSFAETR